MNHSKAILLLSLIIFTSCENEELLTVDTNYKEYLVVQSEIVPNEYFPGVRLTKTLPLGIPYDIDIAEITDATMYLKINDVKVVPLHYKIDGIYMTQHELYINPGDYYELFGERGDKTFYARTKIPFPPNIENVFYNPDEHYSGAVVHTLEDECYAALWSIYNGTFRSSADFFNVTIPVDVYVGSTISVRSAVYPEEYHSSIYNGKRYIQIYSFDTSFSKYFITKSGNQVISNPYAQGTTSTDWNIEGENVIGMFIGVAKSNMVLVN